MQWGLKANIEANNHLWVLTPCCNNEWKIVASGFVDAYTGVEFTKLLTNIQVLKAVHKTLK